MKQVARQKSLAAGIVVAGLLLAGCSSGGAESSTEQSEAVSDTAAVECEYPVTVTDMAGNDVTVESADSVVVTDNRAFAVLSGWGVQPTAAARSLMSAENSWADDESILDTGSHAEPNFDQVIAADPTLIISGYRYGDHAEKLHEAAPDAAFLDMDDPDLNAREYSEKQVRLLAEVFCQEEAAEQLLTEFDEAVEQAKAAYDPEMTVMGLITSGNEIRYASHDDGRGASTFFTLLDLTPALADGGSANHQGDDISIEAIAQAEPDFFLVMDRDAAISTDDDVTPALELINGSAALASVPAVENEAIYVMPADYYLTEDVHAYIQVLNGLKESFEAHR